MAVRKDCGLKNPGSQTEEGRLKSEVQASSSLILSSRSEYQPDKPKDVTNESPGLIKSAGQTVHRGIGKLRPGGRNLLLRLCYSNSVTEIVALPGQRSDS